MSRKITMSRRALGRGLAATAALPLALRIMSPAAKAGAAAGTDTAARAWQKLEELAGQAQRLGLSVPRMSAQPSAAEAAYEETTTAIIDFMDGIAVSRAEATGARPDQVDAIIEQASEALRTARNEERLPREIEEPGVRMGAAPAVKAPKYEDVADGYAKLFETCTITEAKRSSVMWAVSKMTDSTRRAAYEKVYIETCVPWYVVGLCHAMEASFDMTSHLHNGDSLKARTWQVPANRPPVWSPPNDWVSSATDALRYDKFDEKSDWELPKLLYRLEGYNGWRSRQLHSINTPYLWSYSNHYAKGKYVRDGVWDPNAVSKQPGAAVILKALVETGAVSFPA